MIHSILTTWDKKSAFTTASAHCDIPCKIYDPSSAQICALTIIRMIDLIEEINRKESLTTADYAQLIRLTGEKESHGVKLKEDIRVIWGDYFKQTQIEKFPNIHSLVHNIMMQASKSKQGLDRENGLKLLTLMNEFASIFWETKGVPTMTATCPYPPSLPVVYPKLESV